jgi:hypothetical protein
MSKIEVVGGRTLHNNSSVGLYSIDTAKYARGESSISSDGGNIVYFSYEESGSTVVDSFNITGGGVAAASQTYNGKPTGALYAWNPGGAYETQQGVGEEEPPSFVFHGKL